MKQSGEQSTAAGELCEGAGERDENRGEILNELQEKKRSTGYQDGTVNGWTFFFNWLELE